MQCWDGWRAYEQKYVAIRRILCSVAVGGGHTNRNMLRPEEFYAVLRWVEGILGKLHKFLRI